MAYGHKCSEFRPCARCVKMSRPCLRVVAATQQRTFEESPIFIERPVTRTGNTLRVNCSSLPSFSCEINWARAILSRLLEAGTRVDRIAQSIASLTLEQRSVISDALSHASSAAAAMSPACAQIHRRGGFTAATASAVQPRIAAGTGYGAWDTDDRSPSFRPVAWCRLRRRSQPVLSRTETPPATG